MKQLKSSSSSFHTVPTHTHRKRVCFNITLIRLNDSDSGSDFPVIIVVTGGDRSNGSVNFKLL